MRGKKFGWLFSGASALGALLGAIFMEGQIERTADSPAQRVLWAGAFFLILFAFGFVAMQLAMAMNKTYKVQRSPMWPVAFLLAGVLVFGIAAGGQYLFMYSKEEVTTSAQVDMVLLLDASGSMDSSGFNDPRTEAACRFVDSMRDDSRLQAVSFAGRVIDSTGLLPMDAANKDILKQMIRAIDASGTTDFNEPLSLAMNTLNSQGRPDCNKAVVLLTDGQADLDSRVVSDYLASDIRVFTIRISYSTSLTGDEQALVDLAQGTGGFDTLLVPRADGSIDTAAMLQAFQDAFQATSETKINMREDLIVYAKNGVTFWQWLLRVLVFALCAIVIGFGYFGTVSIPSIIGNGALGVAGGVLVSILESGGFFLCALITVLLVGTAYVFLDLRGEDHYDV